MDDDEDFSRSDVGGAGQSEEEPTPQPSGGEEEEIKEEKTREEKAEEAEKAVEGEEGQTGITSPFPFIRKDTLLFIFYYSNLHNYRTLHLFHSNSSQALKT